MTSLEVVVVGDRAWVVYDDGKGYKVTQNNNLVLYCRGCRAFVCNHVVAVTQFLKGA